LAGIVVLQSVHMMDRGCRYRGASLEPASAVLLGAAVVDEVVLPHEWAGMAIMLAAAWHAIRHDRA